MDKWLYISKKGHDADSNATKSSKAELSIGKQTSNMRKRKYDESFLQLGFTFKNRNGYEKPLCLICNKLIISYGVYETIKIEKTS